MDPDFHLDSLLDGEFSMRTALSLARASDLAYEEEEKVRAAVREWGLEPTAIFDRNDTEGFIAGNDQLLVLAFRGTVNLADWLRNLKIIRRDTPIGKVHGGFKQGLEAVWQVDVEPVLRRAAERGQKVWITGHSLGGALATLAAAWCHEWADVRGVYTYGQPLVGNKRFASLFNDALLDRFHRFVNNRDIVTKVPPAPMFSHVDKRIQLDKDGDLIEASRSIDAEEGDEDEALSEIEFEIMQQMLGTTEGAEVGADERGLLPKLPFFTGIDDHNMEKGYIPKLRQNVEEGA